MLGREVLETFTSGEISDTSQFFEHGLHEWVKFRDETVPYLDDNPVLGRYLGPSIDVGPALTAKSLKKNEQVDHSSTYRVLTPDEWESCAENAACDHFDMVVTSKLGASAIVDEFL